MFLCRLGGDILLTEWGFHFLKNLNKMNFREVIQ